jgi:uncharacterized membrane protein YbhN (UPF0104 family)
MRLSLPDVHDNLHRSWRGFSALTLLAALLSAGALIGLSWVAGFGAVEHRLEQVRWPWLLVSLGGMLSAFVGYRVAFEGIARVRGGPRLSPAERTTLVTAGFGGFIARGGSAVDRVMMEAAGASRREAEVRVAALDSLEHVPIAIGGCAAAWVLIAAGRTGHPPADFVWPWALAPPIGGAIAVWAAARYRERLRRATSWRRLLGVGLDGVWSLIAMIRDRTAHGLPYAGMCLFWAGDVLSLWAAMAAFGFRMNVAALIVAYAIGYALTRRSAPLGGAGMIETFLPLTLWDSGAPLAAAIAGVLAYRVFNLWLPMPAAFAVLPQLRRIEAPSTTDRRRADFDLGVKIKRWFGADHLEHGPGEVTAWIVVAVTLALGGLVGLGAVAGYPKLAHIARHVDWVWFAPAFGAEVAAYIGYAAAYREIARVEGGPTLELPRVFAIVASGFGMFIPRGGFVADYRVLVDSGLRPKQARLRVLGLGGLEYAVLAPAACAAAIFLLVVGADIPLSFTLPWAIAVPIGFAGGWVVLQRRDAWLHCGRVRRLLARAVEPGTILRDLALAPRLRGARAGGGMLVYWAADIFCLWACLHAFSAHAPPVATLIVGYATGYALSRRTLPLAGAGAVEVLLPLSLTWVDVRFAPALLAVFAYRIFNLWLPLVPALASHSRIGREAKRPRFNRAAGRGRA